jgi:hypothetical protein
MHQQTLILAALMSLGLGGVAAAETVPTDNGGIAVKDSGVTTPGRGMTMSQVSQQFGAPVSKIPPVGKPPISRWEYPGFIVYFENDHVIHSVVAG